MTPTLALTPVAVPLARADAEPLVARVAVHADPLEPPRVDEVREADPARLIERVFVQVAGLTALPVLAVRELVENLVHAEFAGATVSVLDAGRTVMVSDTGPGIPDVALALTPGFTTANRAARRVIRGVGSGLPLAAQLIASVGGRLDLAPNLRGGTVATLAAPAAPPRPADAPLSETARRLLALLVEVGPSSAEALAAELDVPLAECGRDLALLEHRGLVARNPQGDRGLTAAGSALLATLF
jgi:hypothetical protein